MPQHHFRSVSWRFKSETRKFKFCCSSLPDLLGLSLQLLTHQGPRSFLPFQQQLNSPGQFWTAAITSSLKQLLLSLNDFWVLTPCWPLTAGWWNFFGKSISQQHCSSLRCTADKGQLSIVAPRCQCCNLDNYQQPVSFLNLFMFLEFCASNI